ncbi:MAG: DUF5667 domain-containing protein [Anaerolineales bacterium]|jgi:hypothetical protein|nr:DUF5667 domain-containing protein [Anaerolineales bacterium]
MAKNKKELDEYLAGKLSLLEQVSPINPQAAAEERQKFLMQAAQLRAAGVQRPVQPRARGISGWLVALRSHQRRAASQLVLALVLALALIMGSAGATVYAAQQSLPEEALYPLKIWTEDTRLSLTHSPESRLELMLDFSSRRLAEIADLRSQGKPVPETTFTRAQQQLDLALQIAAEMNDQQLVQALGQIRQQAEVQTEQMKIWMGSSPDTVDPVLEQLRTRLQTQAEVAAEGELDPEAFRQLVRAWTRERLRPAPENGDTETTPKSPNGNQGTKPTVTPGQYGPGSPEYNRPPIEKDPGDGSGDNGSALDEKVLTNPTPVPTAAEELVPAQSRP